MPAPLLRWVERKTVNPLIFNGSFTTTERVLQQWFIFPPEGELIDSQTGDGEWRDVPVELE